MITLLAQLLFPYQANGSVIVRDGKMIGSDLIAQPFSRADYFWPRPSSAGANGFDASSGSGSNLAPSNPALVDAVNQRIATLRAADPDQTSAVPIDLVTASASGLDPHISRAGALYQLPRVARARQRSEAEILSLVDKASTSVWLSGQEDPVVNVLHLNVLLDESPTESGSVSNALVGWKPRGFQLDPR